MGVPVYPDRVDKCKKIESNILAYNIKSTVNHRTKSFIQLMPKEGGKYTSPNLLELQMLEKDCLNNLD